LGRMVSSPGNLMNMHADMLPTSLVIDKLLRKAATHYATLPKTHPLHAAVRNTTCFQHVKRHPSLLHFLMNAYTDVQQGLVEVIPAARQ
jgi:hypothetical protein